MRCTSRHLRLCPQLRHLPDGESRDRAIREIFSRVRLRPSYFAALGAAALVPTSIALALIHITVGISGAWSAWSALMLPVFAIFLWVSMVAFHGAGLWLLWRSDTREALSLLSREHTMRICPSCGYPLGSNDSPFCPECGAIVPFLRGGPDRQARPNIPPSPSGDGT